MALHPVPAEILQNDRKATIVASSRVGQAVDYLLRFVKGANWPVPSQNYIQTCLWRSSTRMRFPEHNYMVRAFATDGTVHLLDITVPLNLDRLGPEAK